MQTLHTIIHARVRRERGARGYYMWRARASLLRSSRTARRIATVLLGGAS